jgi:hypothetical protein
MDLSFETLKGLTIAKIEGATPGSDEVLFESADGRRFKMYHRQVCCEGVSLESVDGDIPDLIGSEIIQADEETSDGNSTWGSATWTFYKLATVKGYVTLRWFGESNGCYSESVDFGEVGNEPN